MKIYTVIFILFINLLSYGQKSIYIFDKIAKTPVEYATIKFLNLNDGTYSNDKGIFELPLEVENISISCIGFESKNISKIISDSIFLKPKINLLEEVIVKAKKKEIYGKNKSKIYINFSSNSESIIFAKKISFDDDIIINKAHFDIHNDDNEKKYRFLIFNLNSDNFPKANITHKNIVAEIMPNQKNITIDLSSNEVFLEKGDYYLGVEIFDLLNKKSSIKIGCYKTKYNNESLSKPVFSDTKQWQSIKNYNSKKEYSFNFYLTIEK